LDHQLIFLGTAAGCGVPSFFCGCVACQEAADRPSFFRSRSSLLIQGEKNTLIDAPPDLRAQLLREHIDRIDHFFLTHWHYDHSGGLGELEFYVRVKRQEAIAAYMTAETEEWLKTSFWFLEDCLSIQVMGVGWQVEANGLQYTALPVSHTPGTIGLLIETPEGRRAAYLPDTGPLPDAALEMIQGIDTLILSATFWGRNWMPEDHLSVAEAVQTALMLNAKQTYLTHLSMHHDAPVTNCELEAYIKTFGKNLHLAYDGLQIAL
jgi:phosphoribosyl 1,2-cyclic phosphate phosphodiesterase